MKFLDKFVQKFRVRLAFKKIEAFRTLDGWLTDQEALGLYEVASFMGKDLTIVEIGSWQGKSTYCLAMGMQSGALFAIDPFNGDAGYDHGSAREYSVKKGGNDLSLIFLNNMTRLGVMKKIKMMKGYSQEFYQRFSNIDILFIDGDHSIEGCSRDFNLYANKLVPGGFLIFHDYYEDRQSLGPTYVIQHIVMENPAFKFYKQIDSMWIARKVITE